MKCNWKLCFYVICLKFSVSSHFSCDYRLYHAFLWSGFTTSLHIPHIAHINFLQPSPPFTIYSAFARGRQPIVFFLTSIRHLLSPSWYILSILQYLSIARKTITPQASGPWLFLFKLHRSCRNPTRGYLHLTQLASDIPLHTTFFLPFETSVKFNNTNLWFLDLSSFF